MVEWTHREGMSPYEETVRAMEARVEAIRHQGAQEAVWLLEHPPLYTAGTSADPADLLDSARFPVYASGRGGQYTYHGPGQRVAYVMLDLSKRQKTPDVRCYVHALEEWLIRSLAHFDVAGERREGRVGIWVQTPEGEKKIAALGVRIRRWVTYHGVALNLCPDLSHFSGIVPCGLQSYGVTSLKELGKEISFSTLDRVLQDEFVKVFEAYFPAHSACTKR